MILTPAMAAMALQILPSIGSLVGKLTGKEKDAKLLSTILALPGMAAGILGKSSSTGLKIGKGTASEADSLTDMFKPSYSSGGFANLLTVGPPTQPGRFKPIEPMYGIGAGWGI